MHEVKCLNRMDFGQCIVGLGTANEQASLLPVVEPEQLGSVTHNHDAEGSSTGLQTRSSARVSKKMRLDLISSPSTQSAADKKEGVKEEDKSEIKTPEPKQSKTPDSKHGKTPDGKPRRRPWELWSQEDKDTFFEALNDLGKDFEAVQNHFTVKARKKGVGDHIIKNKDQIRHFYYRTWHKISKHLKFADGKISEVKKATQELYALINYGELRKKLGSAPTEKTCVKLNELIHKGYTQIRLKGKTIRVKTPLCRALRRLNQVDECQEDLKLPARVNVELRPRTNEAWTRVQATSHNPRVRTILPLQKRLSTLLLYLSQTWKTHQEKLRKPFLNVLDSPDAPVLRDTKNKKEVKDPLLRLAPRPGVAIALPSINLSEYLTSSILSLNSYEERINSYLALAPPGRVKKAVKRQRNESQGDKKQRETHGDKKAGGADDKKTPGMDERLDRLNTDKRDRLMNNIEDNACDNNLEDLMAARQNCSVDGNTVLSSLEQESNKESKSDEAKSAANEETISKVRCGWTIEDANAVSIGELYLMFGRDSRLLLDYWWDPPPDDPPPLEPPKDVPISSTPSTSQDFRVTSTSVDSPAPTSSNAPTPDGCASKSSDLSVSATLTSLLSLARLNLRKGRVECPCGHICGGPPTLRPPTFPYRPIRADPHEKTDATPDLVDGVFRRPQQPSHLRTIKPGSVDAFKQQLDNFYPRYCNRRGRAMRPKNVVVPRMLPLLPKAPNGTTYLPARVMLPVATQIPIKVMSGNVEVTCTNPTVFVNAEVVVTSAPGSGNTKLTVTTSKAVSKKPDVLSTISIDMADQRGPVNTEPLCSLFPPRLESEESVLISSLPSLDTPISSPPSISNLLDLSGADDLSLSSAPSFVGLLSRDVTLATPPSSPSRLLGDNQWLNSEVADFSLSSFLGHLESPLKLQDEPRTNDVDPQLQGLINDNSVDFVAKFQDFIASGDSTSTK